MNTALVLGVYVGYAAVAEAKPRAPVNMPRGWTWPPSTAMKRSGKRCLRRLRQLGVRVRTAPRLRKVAVPIRLRSMNVRGVELRAMWRKPPFTMDCHLALAFAETAPLLRKLGVRALRFSTIHRYRGIRRNGRSRRHILSRHAVGLAIDVYEIVGRDGRTRVVKRDYRRRDRLLLAVERAIQKSPHFRALITPRTDPRSHHDHYHFEARMRIR